MIYTGLAAQYYDAFFSSIDEDELQFYANIILAHQAPALEIACGTGRLLLPLFKHGCNVEGFDASDTMLTICKQKASQQQLHPTLYAQQMQTLTLPKQYGCLFSPLGSFQQLAQLDDAYTALKRFYDHLLPNGQLIIYLYLPWYNAPEYGTWHQHDPVAIEDCKYICVNEKAVHDPIEQQLFIKYKYQLFQNEALLVTEGHDTIIRWYSRNEFTLMLNGIGFKDIMVKTGYNDTSHADIMIFLAKR